MKYICFALLAASIAQAQSNSDKAALYASVGAELTQYDVDAQGAALTRRGSVTLPESVQYAWPHPSGHYLYVAWSNGAGSNHHGVTAFRIDAKGALSQVGEPVALPARPVHITVDIAGTHILVAFNDPSGLSVYAAGQDGRILSLVKQPAGLDFGIYAHQVRVDPSNEMVILVTRGNGPARGKAEDPGALTVFGYDNGVLANRASIAPNRGFGFQPRHLDFEPDGPWVFVSLERQSRLQVYKKLPGGTLDSAPLFDNDSLASPGERRGQAAGTIHVHPNGKFVYQANRAGGLVEFQGKRVFAGGENSIAVYSINHDTGEPTLIQHMDTRGFEPRTFALDPSARILVAANQDKRLAREGESVITVPASLSVFRVGGDGKLEYVRKYDVETSGGKNLFWMGIVALR